MYGKTLEDIQELVRRSHEEYQERLASLGLGPDDEAEDEEDDIEDTEE